MANDTLTIRTKSEILESLTELAESMERSRNWVIEDALKKYLATQAWQVEAIKEGISSIDNGKSVGHEKVANDLDKLLAKFNK